ncbi:MAG: VOC family protein [Nevskia sp.]|nr:VOC family protein [Nevskia sp.]
MHVGLLVHDQNKENEFYRALLGFRPYWYGGMQPGKTDFVSQQLPDGRDYLEYELIGGPLNSRGAANLSQRQPGDLNHFSVGVVNIARAYDTLKAANRLTPPDAVTRIACDGKWQLNVLDPDGTRLEYEELSNVQPPCCSDFTQPNP